jgi:putative DNA methylase
LAWENDHEPPIEPEAVKKYLLKYAPPVYDPFCGRGFIPLEAQRLGIKARGSDLNPVAVLIAKALIEIPPKFQDKPPVNPESLKSKNINQWLGMQGLTEDVRYYGKWMRDEAEKRIGHLYPKVELPKEHGGGEATVIAWLWARTVKCPNPACGCQMPLMRSFQLSKKKGKEAWVEPIIDNSQTPPMITFEITTLEGKSSEGTTSKKGSICIACTKPVKLDYIRREGKSGRMNVQLVAIVAEGNKKRIYLTPNEEHKRIAASAKPTWKPETELSTHPQYMGTPRYGMTRHCDLFTNRQLVALNTFCDLVNEVRDIIKQDADSIGLHSNSLSPNEEKNTAYTDAIATYLAFLVDKQADICNTLNRWESKAECPRNLFNRQAIPMVWDFAEGNPCILKLGSQILIV